MCVQQSNWNERTLKKAYWSYSKINNRKCIALFFTKLVVRSNIHCNGISSQYIIYFIFAASESIGCSFLLQYLLIFVWVFFLFFCFFVSHFILNILCCFTRITYHIVHLSHWSVSSSLRQNNQKRNENISMANDNMSSFHLNFVDILSVMLLWIMNKVETFYFSLTISLWYTFHSKLKNGPKTEHLFDDWPWTFHKFTTNVFLFLFQLFLFSLDTFHSRILFSFMNRNHCTLCNNHTTNTTKCFYFFWNFDNINCFHSIFVCLKTSNFIQFSHWRIAIERTKWKIKSK